MLISEFLQQIEKVYLNEFPNSGCQIELNTFLRTTVSAWFKIAKTKDECINKIWENDLLHFRFNVEIEGGIAFTRDSKLEDKMPDNLQITVLSNFYTTKTEKQYMHSESKKFNIRKTKGNPEKLIKYFEKVVKSLKADLLQSLSDDKIMNDSKVLLASKLGVETMGVK